MKHKHVRTSVFALSLSLSLWLCAGQVRASVNLPAIFSDHMVIQRDMPWSVWGWAAPDEAVTVEFAGQKKTATADADGDWTVHLAKMPATATPQTMTVTGKDTVQVNDVLVGDVWLCSGQSNMVYRLGWDKAINAEALASMNDTGIRQFLVDYHTSPTPDEKLQPSGYQVWEVPTAQNAGDITAVGYYFARELRKRLGPSVPIGLVLSAYGATPGEAWVSREGLSKDPDLNSMADRQIAKMVSYPDDVKTFAVQIAAWEDKYSAKDAGNTGEAKGWAKPDYDDSAWNTVQEPLQFQKVGMKAGGALWLRKTLDIPASAAGKGFRVTFNYANIDYAVYFNGVQVASDSALPKFFYDARGFNVPGDLVKPGKNMIAIRAFAHTGNQYYDWLNVRTDDDKDIFGSDPHTWKSSIEFANPELPAGATDALPKTPDAVLQYTSTYLFNAMIHPILQAPIKGVIWYQGESNAGRAYQYRKLLPALIADWRVQWHQPNLPFHIEQLASFMASSPQPQTNSEWAELRESQLMTATQVPGSGLAVAIDIGDANDIHPKDKMDVGYRLAQIALAKTYGRKIEYSGPLYVSSAVGGGAIRLKFLHVTGGLVAKGGGPLKQFAIAGDDKKFVWADARIDGDTVVVSNPQVPRPMAVRYAWGDNPDGCNLYNGAGLPASPFRTDSWQGVTFGKE